MGAEDTEAMQVCEEYMALRDAVVEEHQTLSDLVLVCLDNKEFVTQFDRLFRTNLSGKGSGLELAIDKATGRRVADMEKFVEFVKKYVVAPLEQHAPRSTHAI